MRSIIPQDKAFFEQFNKICVLMVEASEKLKIMVNEGKCYDEHARRIKAIESECDEVVHHTMEHLHKTFVTPIDRQDIHKLAVRLDDILDLTEASSTRIELYQPKQVPEEVRQMADVLVLSTLKVQELIGLLRNYKKQSDRIKELTVEIDRLENEADQLRRIGIARLFREENDPKELIKWKDILEHMEAATDRCEDISDVVEGILVENT